jgi:hypothetical protein
MLRHLTRMIVVGAVFGLQVASASAQRFVRIRPPTTRPMAPPMVYPRPSAPVHPSREPWRSTLTNVPHVTFLRETKPLWPPFQRTPLLTVTSPRDDVQYRMALMLLDLEIQKLASGAKPSKYRTQLLRGLRQKRRLCAELLDEPRIATIRAYDVNSLGNPLVESIKLGIHCKAHSLAGGLVALPQPTRSVSYTTTRNPHKAAKRRISQPEKLHLLVRSSDMRGIRALKARHTRVVLMTHALPLNQAQAVAIHGPDLGSAVPLAAIVSMLREQLQIGDVAFPSKDWNRAGVPLAEQLVKDLRALPAGSAVVIPGHIVEFDLILRDGSRVKLATLTEANPRVTVAILACNSAKSPVTGNTVIGTGTRLTYEQAIHLVARLRTELPQGSLGDVLYALQKSTPLIGLIGALFVLSTMDDDDDDDKITTVPRGT